MLLRGRCGDDRGQPSRRVFAMGLLLLAYLVGLTYAAKQEL
jgi:hypothetical protein